MNAEQWKRVKELVPDALELPADERDAFLDRACRTAAGTVDQDLRREVAALVAASVEAEEKDALNSPFLGKAADAMEVTDEEEQAIPEQVGAYRIVRELGRGGMGSVYLAERADGQFKQQVALKVVRRGLDTDDILSRFRYERQILASLDHPHIATLYDGGMTDDGRPYFVMEYVDGVPLTAYCDVHLLSTEQRLALFRTVCHAVQYAHRNLVVHRDLKPSNILVTDDGTVKLLDFGIAKLLTEEIDHTVPRTRTGLRLMTPEYAAPEQVKGEPITTATDVYQLGVLLYELVTGHRPYRLGAVEFEVERAILEQLPTRPSSAVRQVSEIRRGETTTRITPESVSRARSTTAENLGRRLTGDIDTIVLTSLQKEPGRRYASVEHLADDIWRYLNNLPVTARPDTLGYRLIKFVQRHKTSVAAGVAVAVILVAGIVVTTWQARVAAAERDRAQEEAAKVAQVNQFLQNMLSSADPNNTGRDVKVADILDQAAGQIDSTLADQPAVAAVLKNTIGVTYRSLGLYDEGEELLRQALAMRQALYAEPHPEVFRSLNDLAFLYRLKGDYATAESLLVASLHLSDDLFDDASPERAFILSELATHYYFEGAYARAESLQREALAIEQATLEAPHMDVAISLGNLAALRADQGDLEEADSLYRQALDLKRALEGDRHVTVAWTMHDLATVVQDLGRYDEAEALYREALAIRRDELGERHMDYVATLSSLATVMIDQEERDEAEAMLREAVALVREIWDEPYPLQARIINNLGNLLRERGAMEEAGALLEESVMLWRATLPTHPYTADALIGWSRWLLDTGQPARAEPLLREALAIRTDAFPEDHWKIAHAQALLGASLTNLRRYEEAEALLTEGYTALVETYGKDEPETQQARRYLVGLYEAWNRPEQAARYTSP